jgi:hypothetical protein
MPLPTPKTNESKKDFMSRCMGSSVMGTEFPDEDQRVAVCSTQWGSIERSDKEPSIRMIRKDEEGFERIVFAEVLLPDVDNTHGDFHTEASVREFAYGFMLNGFGYNLEHIEDYDLEGKVHLIESFIAREGDKDFIAGAWVVGLYVEDDALWDMVLAGEVNGFSYEAMVYRQPVDMEVPIRRFAQGETQPDPFDGHTHTFAVVLDDNERPILGGTSESNGHTHTISRHTYTDESFEHTHIFNYTRAYGD